MPGGSPLSQSGLATAFDMTYSNCSLSMPAHHLDPLSISLLVYLDLLLPCCRGSQTQDCATVVAVPLRRPPLVCCLTPLHFCQFPSFSPLAS